MIIYLSKVLLSFGLEIVVLIMFVCHRAPNGFVGVIQSG